MTTVKRCAIYTRKSSDEGLEQGFNSLHAQREACEAYVLSQAGEGWTLLRTHYDDGGFSGGNLERPGMKALLTDIAARKVDIVVVYKVDRLTRSLADFAKIVEQFDKQEVSFVSVTQAFNTTNSMGRLTLNVLLSFAQFEREVTGERIRDKIAASKAKGLCMGGRPPLGYDIREGRYAVNEGEAPLVRRIFARYLEGASVPTIAEELERDGIRSKAWISPKGVARGGAVFSRGALQHLLTNPVYRGCVRHKEKVYPDCHPAIIDQALWDEVQTAINDRAYERAGTVRRVDAARFRGLVRDDRGAVMQVVEARSRTRSYLYYQSPPHVGLTKPAAASLTRMAILTMDDAIIRSVLPHLALAWMPDADEAARVRAAMTELTASTDRLVFDLRVEALADGRSEGEEAGGGGTIVRRSVPIRLARKQGALLVEAQGAHSHGRLDRTLTRAVVLSRAWAEQLERGEVASIKALARAQVLCEHYTAKLLPLAYLAPDLFEQILQGRQPRSLTLAGLIDRPLPLDWADQRRVFAAL